MDGFWCPRIYELVVKKLRILKTEAIYKSKMIANAYIYICRPMVLPLSLFTCLHVFLLVDIMVVLLCTGTTINFFEDTGITIPTLSPQQQRRQTTIDHHQPALAFAPAPARTAPRPAKHHNSNHNDSNILVLKDDDDSSTSNSPC